MLFILIVMVINANLIKLIGSASQDLRKGFFKHYVMGACGCRKLKPNIVVAGNGNQHRGCRKRKRT